MAMMPSIVRFAKQEARALGQLVREIAQKTLPAKASFADREAAMLAVTNEAVRVGLEEELQSRADGFGAVVVVEGKMYKRHEDGAVVYHSLCGPLGVRRATYRAVGVHNGPTIVPLELQAGLVERATPALAKSVALGYAKTDLRSHAEDLVAAARVPPSRSTEERMAKRMAETVAGDARRIEANVRRSEHLPEGACSISVGLDRTSVPMAELLPAEAAAKRPRRKEPYVREPPPPVEVKYRMAYVGTVSFNDADGNSLEARKYAIPAEDDPVAGVIEKMMRDVGAAHRANPTLNIGIVQDGAPEMWNLVRAGLANEPSVRSVAEGIDRYHLRERLAKALSIVEPGEREREAQMSAWNKLLDETDAAIDQIELTLIRRHAGLKTADAAALWEHLVYLRNNKDRMRYVTLRALGVPVGSGVTEGSCKSVIGKRTKGGGQRWSLSGLRNVLTLRSFHCSARFPPLWKHLARTYTAAVANG